MCKALSFVDACTEEHFAAMSRSSPPPASAGRGPRFFICAGELNSPGIKVLPPAKRLYAPPGAGGSSTR